MSQIGTTLTMVDEMTIDEALAKIQDANKLIFEVEKMFVSDKSDVFAKNNIENNGYRARIATSGMEHELLIRKGVRQR